MFHLWKHHIGCKWQCLAAPEQLSEVVSQVRTAEQSSLRESSSTSHDWKDNSKGDVSILEAKKRGISFGEDYQIFCVIYLHQRFTLQIAIIQYGVAPLPSVLPQTPKAPQIGACFGLAKDMIDFPSERQSDGRTMLDPQDSQQSFSSLCIFSRPWSLWHLFVDVLSLAV